jgi:hypothetical protein
MLCPFNSEECKQEMCAWWDSRENNGGDQEGQCVVFSLLDSLEDIAESIDEVIEGIEGVKAEIWRSSGNS